MTDERCAFEIVEQDGPCQYLDVNGRCDRHAEDEMHQPDAPDGIETVVHDSKGLTYTILRTKHAFQPRVLSVCGKPEWPIVRGVAYPDKGIHALHEGTHHGNYKCHAYVPGHTCEDRWHKIAWPLAKVCPSCACMGVIADTVTA